MTTPNSTFPAVLRQTDLRIWAVLLSMVLALISINTGHELNNDAYVYLRAAELYGELGAHSILESYGWHGYSIIIALTDRVFPGGLLTAAYFINISLGAVLVYAFISLAMEYRDTPAIRLIAALTVLCFPSLNEIHHYLIRDFGFWAFSLLALLGLVRFHKSCHPVHAVIWCLGLLAATFFRLEGLVLIALSPFSLLCRTDLSWPDRLKLLSVPGLVLLLALAAISILAMLAGLDLLELFAYSYRNYLPRILDYSTVLAATADNVNAALYHHEFFPGHGASGMLITIVAYLYTLVHNIVVALTGPGTLILAYGIYRGACRCDRKVILPTAFFLLATCIYLFVFITTMRFSTERYATLAGLILLSFIPLCIEHLYLQAQAQQKLKLFRGVFGFILLYFVVDSFISFGYSKQFIHDASRWVSENATAGTTLVTNNRTIAYESGLVEDYDKVEVVPEYYLDRFPDTGLVALELKRREAVLIEDIENRPGVEFVISFNNERNDQVRIYRVQSTD